MCISNKAPRPPDAAGSATPGLEHQPHFTGEETEALGGEETRPFPQVGRHRAAASSTGLVCLRLGVLGTCDAKAGQSLANQDSWSPELQSRPERLRYCV